MKKIKILFADPRHYTVGSHSSFTPIGIGYIASYLETKIEKPDLEIELSIKPDEIFNLIDNWKPDLVACSNYIWNSSLSYRICEYAKEKNINTLCVLGGPEFPAGTGARKIENTEIDQTYTKCLDYLLKRPSVDYFCYCDGEVTYPEIVKKFIENNFSTEAIKKTNKPIPGCVSVYKTNLLVGEYIARIGMEGSVKVHRRDIVPSPYLNGMLDKFLDGRSIPAFETDRGCPFQCSYCDQGLDQSKIAAFSTNRIAKEMMYVGKKMSKLKNGTKTASIFNANFGMFQKDIDLADEILKTIEKYDWPQYIHATTPKSNWNNSLIINDKLKNRLGVGLAMQSTNIETLKNVKRRNWGTDAYIDFIREIEKRGKDPISEIIVPLPDETEESYFKGIEFLMNNNVQVGTYTLMMLVGAELGRDQAIKKYEIKSKFRILPKQFGEYKELKVFEIEQICVGTNTMNFESYLKCRNFSFIVRVLNNKIFSPVYRLLNQFKISWYDFCIAVYDMVQDENHQSKLKNLYNDFCEESHNELFESKEDAINFYSKPENYEALKKGLVGENLLGKYNAESLFALDDIITVVFYAIRNKLSLKINKDTELILNSSEKWLKNLYIIDTIFDDSKGIEKNYNINLDFDFPSWDINSKEPVNNFINFSTYEFSNDINKISFMRNEIQSVFGKDKKRAFGRYLMAHTQKGFEYFERQYQRVN